MGLVRIVTDGRVSYMRSADAFIPKAPGENNQFTDLLEQIVNLENDVPMLASDDNSLVRVIERVWAGLDPYNDELVNAIDNEWRK